MPMIDILRDYPLAKLSSFHLGGPARFFVAVYTIEELREAVTQKIPWVVLGGMSNVLISDVGFPGLVIKLEMKKITIEGTTLRVDAGAAAAVAAAEAAAAGLTGFEWAAGVPGTIGGAVRGNAGASGGEMQDVVSKVTVFDAEADKIFTLTKDESAFAYRESIFKRRPNWIVLGAEMALAAGNAEESKQKIRGYIEHRNRTQPKKYGSSGCGFKNVEVKDLTPEQIARLREFHAPEEMLAAGRVSAGWLIQQAGLSGVKIGGAMVSHIHCNFIVNTGAATAKDVAALIALVKKNVQEKFGVELREEIVYIGW
ncbi:MAG: UDP-N-acetylenolpyruvoylglucosamine reductase [Candidatus Magasanikbacteria bacterium]|nr:UDP-N-acetylenolpyruvoylglucosamine reductase [Candidatus Magasanikbacteria bacterium]